MTKIELAIASYQQLMHDLPTLSDQQVLKRHWEIARIWTGEAISDLEWRKYYRSVAHHCRLAEAYQRDQAALKLQDYRARKLAAD